MDRQRLLVLGEVQAGWLLVAHRTADQQVVALAERAHSVLAVVEHFEIRVRGEDHAAIEGRSIWIHPTGVSASSRPRRTSDGIVLPSVSSICLPHRKQRWSG